MSDAPNTAISSESELGEYAAGEAMTSDPSEGEPSEGMRLQTLSSGDEGLEDVPGYDGPAGALADLWTPPTVDLPDAGEASFGPLPPAAESVIGVDDRIKIQNTAEYPWRAQASLVMTAADGSQWIGSGTFIGPRTVLTAGHCVYIKGSGVPGRDGWMRSITVMPGRNGSATPYGAKTSSAFRSVTAWTVNGNQEYDYGVIILPSSFNNGWFGITSLGDGDVVNSVGNIAGYPGDKPAGTMWYHSRKILSVGPRKVYYDIDTAGGQSGSGVYRLVNNQRHVIAVHAYGGGANSGTRINGEVFNFVASWIV